ncbi:hypothetical protein AB0M87_04435 [Streptomyces sp. NPDC051320]|uniref:hypothetical protein n=1 Tax=Streptomyces sp. NPDC051320 TaxID=3154644 RepID=UPI00341B53E9
MTLMDAAEQRKRDRPELRGEDDLAKRALRQELARAMASVVSRREARELELAEPPAEAETDKPVSIRDAWLAFLIFGVGVKGISVLVWGSDEPGWFDVAYAVMFVVCVWQVIAAHIRAINGR